MINFLVPLKELVDAFPSLHELSPLNNGGQKNVFSAQHDKWGSVVVKVYSPEMRVERISREVSAQQANLLRVPPVYETCTKVFSTGEFFIAIERRIDGQDLASYYRKHGCVSYEFAVRLLTDIMEVLSSLEAQKLVHRDIKPANIILDAQGRFWLIDFGAVRDLTAQTLTLTGGRAPLTYGYAAPEQYDSAMRDMIDSRADLFALGVTVYTLLKGRNPFLRQGMSEFEVAVTTRQYDATTLEIIGDENGGLAKFIKLLMGKELGSRPPSVRRAREWFPKYVPLPEGGVR